MKVLQKVQTLCNQWLIGLSITDHVATSVVLKFCIVAKLLGA